MQTEKHIYTVSKLTKNIKGLLEGKFPYIWIEGELSNVSPSAAGHIYLSLKDKDALIRAVVFRGSASKLKFDIKDGLKVVCAGKISLYDKSGQYQLIVSSMEPKGIGSLQLAFEQLKEKLNKEGLFDQSRKKPIPFLPEKIGVVTSPTGAAIRDIINVLRRRFVNAQIIICPVKVQGDQSKTEIAQAIDQFNKLNNIDVMIVGRGGGSLEDLWAFNEEIVARAIARSEIPIISAVGHEIDWTIADFVCDFRAPTPSAAAELVLPEKKDLLDRINNAKDRLVYYITNMASQYVQQIDDLLSSLKKSMGYFIRFKKEKFLKITAKMEALSPLAVLSRGYSLTEKEGKIIQRIKDVNKGDVILSKVSDGQIISTVSDILRKNK